MDCLSNLDSNLQQCILMQLEPKTLTSVMQVSKMWQQRASDSSLWERHIKSVKRDYRLAGNFCDIMKMETPNALHRRYQYFQKCKGASLVVWRAYVGLDEQGVTLLDAARASGDPIATRVALDLGCSPLRPFPKGSFQRWEQPENQDQAIQAKMQSCLEQATVKALNWVERRQSA